MARHMPAIVSGFLKGKPLWLKVAAVVVVLLVGGLTERYTGAPQPTLPVDAASISRAEQAFSAGESGVWITQTARVSRTLADDLEGSRHQRFILELDSGHTVLVAHNIDIAERVPLHPGDTVTLHGRYEWNERGGVIHWTHRDNKGHRDGGWIEYQGTRYR